VRDLKCCATCYHHQDSLKLKCGLVSVSCVNSIYTDGTVYPYWMSLEEGRTIDKQLELSDKHMGEKGGR
jgi:hypothetical protein